MAKRKASKEAEEQIMETIDSPVDNNVEEVALDQDSTDSPNDDQEKANIEPSVEHEVKEQESKAHTEPKQNTKAKNKSNSRLFGYTWNGQEFDF